MQSVEVIVEYGMTWSDEANVVQQSHPIHEITSCWIVTSPVLVVKDRVVHDLHNIMMQQLK